MRILPTPPEFRSPPYRYPHHNFGPGMEKYCHLYLEECAENIHSDFIYLPIYWVNNYYYQSHQKGESGFHAITSLQHFLNSLDSKERYITTCLCPDGVYEDLPNNVTVLGSAGTGDIPLPLLCKQHSIPLAYQGEKDLVACYLGAINCGGTSSDKGEKVTQSQQQGKGGVGSRIRRRMVDVFSEASDKFCIQAKRGESYLSTAEFCVTMLRSHYGLAPRGYGKTSFRLYEAMMLDAIPVYIYDLPWLPYTDILDWEEFCILCPEEDLDELPNVLCNTPEDWKEKARKMLPRLVQDYFSFGGVTKQLKRIIEGLN